MITNTNNENYKVSLFEEEIRKYPKCSSALKSKIFDHVVAEIFEQAPPVPGNKEILVSGYVMSDGKGDNAHMLSMVNVLHKKFPDRQIRLIVVSDPKHEGKLGLAKAKNCIEHLAFSSDQFANVPRSLFQEDVVEKAKAADVFIAGPISIMGLFNDIKENKEKNGIAIHEYDYDSNLFHGCGTAIQMGLMSESAGIFTKPKKNNFSWETLNNTRLKEILFNDNAPSSQKIEDYLASHEIFLCYMSDKSRAARFMQQAVIFAEQRDKTKSIDICFPSKKEIHNFFSKERLSELKEKGIGRVTIISYEDNQKKETTIKLSEEKKELRVIDVGFIESKDFKLLTALSAPLMGCTGDNSLGLALSYGKIPCYDWPCHKRNLSVYLEEVVEKNIGDSVLYWFLKNTNAINIDEYLLRSPKLVEEAEKLGTCIQNNYSFNKYFAGTVNHRLYCKQYPGFAKKESELAQKYINNEISRQELEKQLNIWLSDKELCELDYTPEVPQEVPQEVPATPVEIKIEEKILTPDEVDTLFSEKKITVDEYIKLLNKAWDKRLEAWHKQLGT
jgi:hypothetical protein